MSVDDTPSASPPANPQFDQERIAKRLAEAYAVIDRLTADLQQANAAVAAQQHQTAEIRAEIAQFLMTLRLRESDWNRATQMMLRIS